MFSKYILGGSLAVISVLSLALWFSNGRYEDLLVDSAKKIERAEANSLKLETSLEEQKAALSKLTIEMTEQRMRSEFRDIELAETRSTLNEERQKNESYKNRWKKVSNAKPVLISRLINRATRKRVRFFTSATCRANCNPKGNSDNSDSTTEEAGSNSGN